MGLRVVVEVVLLAVLPFEVVDITLVVVNALELLLEEFECKVSEEDALNKRKDAADEGVWVPGFVHVVLGARCGQQVVER